MMIKRKLDGVVDESSADQEICKCNAIVHTVQLKGNLIRAGI